MYRRRTFQVPYVGMFYTRATATPRGSQARTESEARTGVVVVQRNAAQDYLEYACMAMACVFLRVESY